jgi:hypothetical protein
MDRILAGLLVALVFGASASQAIAQSKMTRAPNEIRVMCDSRGFGRQQCAADLRGYKFASVRNSSSVRCEVGRNFGYDDNGVWVDQGCRGEFFFTGTGQNIVGGYGGQPSPNDLAVRCESRDGRRADCPADLRNYYFRDLRQVSRTQCVQGNNWGFDDRGVWVAQGCRAEFMFAAGRYAGPGPDGGSGQRVVACASRDGRRANCAADLRGFSLVNVRQQSRTTCELGRNFGYDDRGIWADQGCRAEFEFAYRGPGYGGGYAGGSVFGNSGYGQPGVVGAAVKQLCESVDNKRVYCGIQPGSRVRLARQVSRAACTEGTTWGVDARGIWVDDGCRGEFEVTR